MFRRWGRGGDTRIALVRQVMDLAMVESMVDHGRAHGRSWPTMTGTVVDYGRPWRAP